MNGAAEATVEMSATPQPIQSSESSHCVRNGLLCAFAVAVCVLLVFPVANMPFGDDFSYTKTALDFARTGHFVYNGWATAMLGWLVPWGALFIKVFGFSFTVVRLSVLPIAMATVYVFHDVLRRFEINEANAVLGALAMALTPLFVPMASTYMTDIPGLFVIVICMYMCQRAVAAHTDRVALLWLCSAALVDVAGGTVRQIAWLGALVMVPSTAWLLRERRGMKAAGVILFLCSFVGVLACLHWFNRQPYSLPEHVYRGPIHLRMLVHLAAELLRALLCLLLVVFPLSVAWLPVAGRLNGHARLRIAGAMAVLALLAIILSRLGRANTWLMPWLIPLLETQAIGGVTTWMKIVMSLLILAPALVLFERMADRKNRSGKSGTRRSPWHEIAWILGPFTLSYICLLAPRATYDIIQDRYLLGLIPSSIVILLSLYQERVTVKMSALSLVTLTVFAVYAVAGAHSLFAGCRALVRAVDMVQSSGVPRKFIQAGMASDGWAQIQGNGYINDSRLVVPPGAYKPDTSNLKLPDECTIDFASFTPAITPRYFLTFPPMSCFAPTHFPPVHYTIWLPPFHRTLYVQQLASK